MSTPLPNTSELAVPDDGGDTDAWGLLLNAMSTAWDRFLGGSVSHSMASADWTLSTEEAENGRLILTGTSATWQTVILPAGKYRTWVIVNLTAGAGAPYMGVIQSGVVTPIYIPQNGAAVVMTVPGAILLASPPVNAATGGFIGLVTQPGAAYQGPGIFFGNREVGIGSPTSGVMSLFLAAASAAAEIKLQVTNTAAAPLLAVLRAGPIYDTGFYFPGGGEVGVSCLGTAVGRFTTGGVAIGAGSTVEGAGTLNAVQLFRSGEALPFQFPVYMSNLVLGDFFSQAHGVGGAPAAVFGKLRCVSADLGYLVGDLIDAALATGLSFGASANLGFCAATGTVMIPHKGTGAMTAAVSARWRLDLILCWP